jgi:hypothetical protein
MSSPTIPTANLRWRKSARSSGGGSNCVEVADAGRVIAVRDSKNPGGPAHAFNRREFGELTSRIRSGQLDL